MKRFNRWVVGVCAFAGRKIEAYLNSRKEIDYTYNEDIDGKIGLWSKADSYVFFDRFSFVTR